MKYVTTIGKREFIVDILDENHVVVDDMVYEVDFDSVSDQPVYSMLVDGRSYEAYVYSSEEGWQVLLHGHLFPVVVEDEREKRLRAAAEISVAERQEFHRHVIRLRAQAFSITRVPEFDGAVITEARQEVRPGGISD